MNDSEPRIPKEMVPEVLALASRLHAKQDQSYSLSELMQAGAEAKIPPEFIQQAVQQIQAGQSQTHKQQHTLKVGLISAGVVVALWGFLAGRVPLAHGHCASMMSSIQETTGAQTSQS